MIKGVTHAHLGSIFYHSEPSNVPYFLNRFLVGTFFAVSYSKIALVQALGLSFYIQNKLSKEWELFENVC